MIEKAKISASDKRASISGDGALRDASGAKQLFDSGLLFDAGLLFDTWGSSPVQGEVAKISRDDTYRSGVSKSKDIAKISIRRD